MRPTRSLLVGLAAAALLAAGGPQPSASASAAGTTPPRTVTGTVRIVVVDTPTPVRGTPPEGQPAREEGLTTRTVIDRGDSLIDVPAGLARGLNAGDTVTVTVAPGDDVAASVVTTAPSAAGPSAPSAGRLAAAVTRPSVVGTHTLTVLRVYWTDPDPAAPVSTLTALADATAEYWSEQSGGRITVVPTVRPWARIADPGSCSPSALANAAFEAHDIAPPTDATDHVLIYFPNREDCDGWAGLGVVGGSVIWDNGYPLIDVVAHEFGHNLGLGHANIASCESDDGPVTLSSSCSVAEYRDYADVMGIAMDAPSGSLNSALADALGLVRTVTAVAGQRTSADLAPLPRVDAGRAVKIRLPSGWVYLDYRPAAGRDVRMPAWAGVQAHLLPDDDIPSSRLLDGQPTTSFADVALGVGTAWTVPDTGLQVTVTSVGAGGAHLEVTPTEAAVPPTPVVRTPAGGMAVGASARLPWAVPSAVSSLQLSVDGRVVSTTAVSTLTGTIGVGGLTHGRHTVTLRAADAAGQLSASSAPLTLTADLKAPSVPGGLALASTQVLRWRRSVDAGSGVAGYLVSMDGGRPTRVTRTSAATRTPVGRHTWWVAAVDRIGNVSPASGLIVVRAAGSSKARSTSVRLVSTATTGQPARGLRGTVGASRPR